MNRRVLSTLSLALLGGCSLLSDFDQPLELPDGSPTICTDDDDCDDGEPCTIHICRNGACEMAEGGDTRDRDGDGVASVACGGDDCNDDNRSISPNAEEICNGVDDNCSGEIDDGEGFECVFERAGDECETTCGSTGIQRCNSECLWECAPPSETCNGADDDCDGDCDEGNQCCAGATVECATTCGTTGTQVCQADCRLPTECSPPRETCNERDDDCDDIIDEPDELRLTDTDDYSQTPSLVWNGSEYGVAWSDNRHGGDADDELEIYFARYDALGERIGSEVRVTNVPGISTLPTLLWARDEWVIAFTDNRTGGNEIYLARLDSTGALIDEVRVSDADESGSSISDVAATETGFGVVWNDKRDAALWEISRFNPYFVLLDAEGAPLTENVRLDENHATDDIALNPALAWDGTHFGVVWSDFRGVELGQQLFFQQIDAAGSLSGENIRVTGFADEDSGGKAEYPDILWSGSSYMVVWRDRASDSTTQLFSRLIDAEGARLSDHVAQVTGSATETGLPRFAWSGSDYGVAYFDGTEEVADVFVARLDEGGGLVGSPRRITSRGTRAFINYIIFRVDFIPAIAWNGSSYAVVWPDNRDDDCEARGEDRGCIDWDELYFATDICLPE